jgi:hypothetical protein
LSNLSKLLRKVLVIAPSSADVERLFSQAKHIKSPRRSRLSVKTLEDLLRLSINGPSDLESFPSAKYAKTWRGIHTGDSRRAGGGHQPTHPKRKNPTLIDSGVAVKQIFTNQPAPAPIADAQVEDEQEVYEIEVDNEIGAVEDENDEIDGVLPVEDIENDFVEPNIFM